MSHRFQCLLLIVLLPALGLAAADSPSGRIAGGTSEARLKQVERDIERLFRQQDPGATPPSPRQNPFRTSTDLPASAGPGQPVDGDADAVLLMEAIKTLSISSGTTLKDNRLSITINQAPYSTGSTVRARVGENVVLIRIVRVTPNSATLGLNDAEFTLTLGGLK